MRFCESAIERNERIVEENKNRSKFVQPALHRRRRTLGAIDEIQNIVAAQRPRRRTTLTIAKAKPL